MKTFAPKLAALPMPQQRLWPELRAIPKCFVLYGGTALALRLGHRQSIDFDFFSSEPFHPDELFRTLLLLQKSTRLQSSANTLTVEVHREGAIKLSFFGDLSLGRVGAPETTEPGGLTVASLLDLAGTKMAVIQERALSKDYLDVHALLQTGIELANMLAAGRALYGDQFNPAISLKALTYFQDGDLCDLPAAVQQRLATAAAAVRDIPEVPRLSNKIAAT